MLLNLRKGLHILPTLPPVLRGQTSTCSFTVTISDNQVPRLADLPDITVGPMLENVRPLFTGIHRQPATTAPPPISSAKSRPLNRAAPSLPAPPPSPTPPLMPWEMKALLRSFTVTVRDEEAPELDLTC